MNSDQPRTPALATFLDSVHVLALAAWLSCLVAAGVAAMGVFSTLPFRNCFPLRAAGNFRP